MSLAETFTEAGYDVTRSWTRDTGDAALLLKPPRVPADLAAVSAIIEEAGASSVPGYPTWLGLRKLVLVVTETPDA